MDQLQIEAATKISITVFTRRSAAKNKARIDNSCEVKTTNSAVSICYVPKSPECNLLKFFLINLIT